MTGKVIQVNLSLGGIPKRPVPRAMLTVMGLEGDFQAHPHIHGGPDKAVLLMAAETIDELAQRGYPVFYGALGENLTTQGLDPCQLRPGQQLRVGAAEIELTKIRVPCATLEVYGAEIGQEIYGEAVQAGDVTSPRWGASGFYARVLRPGMIQADDIISVVATLA